MVVEIVLEIMYVLAMRDLVVLTACLAPIATTATIVSSHADFALMAIVDLMEPAYVMLAGPVPLAAPVLPVYSTTTSPYLTRLGYYGSNCTAEPYIDHIEPAYGYESTVIYIYGQNLYNSSSLSVQFAYYQTVPATYINSTVLSCVAPAFISSTITLYVFNDTTEIQSNYPVFRYMGTLFSHRSQHSQDIVVRVIAVDLDTANLHIVNVI